ncbi:hypothetical protein VNO77_24304 [Canavalia gladiata]|uniref:Uncharacterized protein n=1 Tax=Canavalia gladiata TaxID=3824 RepID=A0AAN9L9B7_CANGL
MKLSFTDISQVNSISSSKVDGYYFQVGIYASTFLCLFLLLGSGCSIIRIAFDCDTICPCHCFFEKEYELVLGICLKGNLSGGTLSFMIIV